MPSSLKPRLRGADSRIRCARPTTLSCSPCRAAAYPSPSKLRAPWVPPSTCFWSASSARPVTRSWRWARSHPAASARAQRRGRPVARYSDREHIDAVARREQSELERRDAGYRHGRPLPSLAERTVILVDDGLATGSTMKAAVQAVRQHAPVTCHRRRAGRRSGDLPRASRDRG